MSTTQTESARNLAQRAKKRLEAIGAPNPGSHSPDEPQRLLHELQVHQVELEMQNEELRHAIAEKEEMEELLGTFSDLYDFAPAGYFNLDHNGIIHAVNLTGAGFLGVERSLLNNRRLDIFISKETQPVYHDFLDKVFAGESKETCEVVFVKKEHSPLIVQIEAVASESRKNCRAVVTDITERKRADEALHERESRYKDIFNHSPIAIEVGAVHSDLIVEVNDAWLQLLGYERDEVIGRTTAELSLYVRNEERDDIIRIIKNQGGIVNVPVQLRQKSRAIIDILYSAELITIDSKPYLQAMMTDITERKRTEEVLRKSEYFFKESQRSASIGSYYTDFIVGKWESSEVLDAIFGIDNDYDRSIQGWLDIVHPDDKGMMDRYLIEEVISNRKPFSKEYRIIRKNDGETRWVNGLGSAGFDNGGNILSLMGTIQDITERKNVEEALLESEERFRNILENAPIGMAEVSIEGRFMLVNSSLCKITGYDKDELERLTFQNITHPDDLEANLKKVKLLLDGSVNSFHMEKRYIRKDHQVVWTQLTSSSVKNHDGTTHYLIAQIEDITTRKHSQEQIQQLAFYDALTNLPNRRLLMDRFVQALVKAKRFQRSLAIMYLDLDDFKRVNDTLGHDIGDELLKVVAGRLHACVRSMDTVCRQGGDEFIVVLSEISRSQDAAVVADKIIKVINEPIYIQEYDLRITTSIGIAIYPENGTDDATELMKKADIAMYEVKNKGRNGFTFYQVV